MQVEKEFNVEVARFDPSPDSEYAVYVAFIPGDAELFGCGASRAEAVANFASTFARHQEHHV